MNHMVVIRYYKPGDELSCQEVVKQGTMSTVNAAFIAGLTREITFQIMILASALMFIFLGVPFTICFSTIPVVIVLMYVFIWMGHMYRVMEMNQDMCNIPRMYMSSQDTGFWVAEVYEPYFMTREPSQVKYSITTEQRLKDSNTELPSFQKKIVGTIAVTKSRYDDNTAWLRRMAVNHRYQRKGIASALLDEALRFCKTRGYSTVELVTTECHDAARELYLKKGFELKQMYHKQVVGTLITILMYDFTYNLKSRNINVLP
ncbi:N-acetyltransferase family 8 member 3 [Anabrus simplex]|uniref:N-acetyltransferase family 8 member 3 n=1 Tax=Anabrus simplex TaxID=316456 RepID=UPI0035A339E9